MARQNPIVQTEIARCRAMRKLRLKLRISGAEFAKLLNISLPILTSREVERVPWQPGEVARVKRKIARHLAAGEKALAAIDA